MGFNQYATAAGITPDSPWIDIIDTAIDYLEEHVRKMPDDEDKTDDWYAWANDRADDIASTFTEEGYTS